MEEEIERDDLKTILIVDDEQPIVDILVYNLKKEGYNTIEASDGLTAIDMALEQKPDLILLDYEMPVCKGSQILEMIRSEDEFADIPVIFLTSRVDKESVKRVVELKPQGYLSKSLSPELIKKEVERFFEKSEIG